MSSYGFVFNQDFSKEIFACIVKIESGGSLYPEVLNRKNLCSAHRRGKPAQGLGQILEGTHGGARTQPRFYGDRTLEFEEIGTRPDVQIEFMIYQINQNLGLDYSSKALRGFMDRMEVDECIDDESPQWIKAVTFYDQNPCSSYIQKMKQCRSQCFGNKNMDEALECLLE